METNTVRVITENNKFKTTVSTTTVTLSCDELVAFMRGLEMDLLPPNPSYEDRIETYSNDSPFLLVVQTRRLGEQVISGREVTFSQGPLVKYVKSVRGMFPDPGHRGLAYTISAKDGGVLVNQIVTATDLVK